MSTRLRRISLLALLVFILVFLFWQSNHRLQTEFFSYSFDRLPDGWNESRIVVLTDLHSSTFGSEQEALLDTVAETKPDVIVLIGDMADADSDLSLLPPLAEGLSAIAPSYYVTGNHEWGAGIVNTVETSFRDGGVTVLQNEFVPLDRNGDTIWIAGIDDPLGYADKKPPEQVAEELRTAHPEDFAILLAHRNTRYEQYDPLGFDLILSGHGHGGLIRLPFIGGLISTERKLFPKWDSGLYTDGQTPLFVSRGLGNTPHTLRLFNRPQVAVFTLQQTNA